MFIAPITTGWVILTYFVSCLQNQNYCWKFALDLTRPFWNNKSPMPYDYYEFTICMKQILQFVTINRDSNRRVSRHNRPSPVLWIYKPKLEKQVHSSRLNRVITRLPKFLFFTSVFYQYVVEARPIDPLVTKKAYTDVSIKSHSLSSRQPHPLDRDPYCEPTTPSAISVPMYISPFRALW